MPGITTETVRIPSGDGELAAWVTRPAGPPPHPVVVLVHGGGAVHDMGLAGYERDFAAAGLAVVAFDFRHLGGSTGTPRGRMSPRRYRQDVRAVLAFTRAHPDLDGDRVALWGTSFGASHVAVAAAEDPRVAAAVVQCPVFSGREIALRAGLRALAGFTPAIVADLLAAATGRDRRYLAVVGRPGERAFVTAPGAWEGWHSLVGEGSAFDNRAPAASALEVPRLPRRRPATRGPLPAAGLRERPGDPDRPGRGAQGGGAGTPGRGPALLQRPLRALPRGAAGAGGRRPGELPGRAPRRLKDPAPGQRAGRLIGYSDRRAARVLV